MSSPREAVFDVLQAKRARAAEAVRRTAAEEWKRYEEQNQVAVATYRGKTTPRGGNA